MTAAQVIACYEQVLAIMQRMHAAADNSEWDSLVALEQECKAVVARLGAHEGREPLDAARQRRKSEIIRAVLVEDAAIRTVTEPWMQKLQGFLGTRRRERQLSATYGANDGR